MADGGADRGLDRGGAADWGRLAREVEGAVLTDAFSRGRYATDASFYQIVPEAVVVPRRADDVAATLAFAREAGVPVTARGGGTSQAGQTINRGVVIDYSKHLNAVRSLDVEGRRATVEPGLVLDALNRRLKPHGLSFPVDVSTASRATIGGMAANNSCGGRSIRHGRMRENVEAIDALLADGTRARFGPVERASAMANQGGPVEALVRDMLSLGEREAEEIEARFPKLLRRVGGYNVDALVPDGPANNLAHLLVGSEGTLALTEAVELRLSPLPRDKVVGVCHFPTFRDAMEATQHLVALGPSAVELVDRTMIELGRAIPALSPSLDAFVRGDPAALLLVEFAEDEPSENRRRLAGLHDTMADLGFAWDGPREGGVLDAHDQGLQAEDHRGPHAGPQHHDVDALGGKAGVVRRGLRRGAARPAGLHRPAHGRVRAPRHHGDLVRPRLGRPPARPARAQPQGGGGRARPARHRRGGLRHRGRVQAARTRASTATASCARSSTSACSAPAWSARSRR